MMSIKDYFEMHLDREVRTFRLKGNWKSEDRINIIKEVNHLESNYVLDMDYDNIRDLTTVSYIIIY